MANATASIHLPPQEVFRGPPTALQQKLVLPTVYTDVSVHGNCFRLVRHDSELPKERRITELEQLIARTLDRLNIKWRFEAWSLEVQQANGRDEKACLIDFLTDLRIGGRRVWIEGKGTPFIQKDWVARWSRVVTAHQRENFFVFVTDDDLRTLNRILIKRGMEAPILAHEQIGLVEPPRKLGHHELRYLRKHPEPKEPGLGVYTSEQATALLRRLRALKARADPAPEVVGIA